MERGRNRMGREVHGAKLGGSYVINGDKTSLKNTLRHHNTTHGHTTHGKKKKPMRGDNIKNTHNKK